MTKAKKSSQAKGGITHDDPLAQIQQEEEKIRQQLSKKENSNREELEKIESEEESKIQKAEEETKETGNQKISEAKQEAQEGLKTKLGDVQREVGSIEKNADASKKDAIDLVIKEFESAIS